MLLEARVDALAQVCQLRLHTAAHVAFQPGHVLHHTGDDRQHFLVLWIMKVSMLHTHTRTKPISP